MIASLIAISVLHWAVLLIPGFNFVLIGQLAAGGSRRLALGAVIGMTSVTFVWAALAVVGVGAVFAAHPAVRNAAQIAGGLYLIYLAFQLARAGAVDSYAAPPIDGLAKAIRAGFITSALNPKIALFYGSVFATALPSNPGVPHIVTAVLLVYANSWIWHGSLALMLSSPAVQRAYLRHYSRMTRISALLVGAFGVRLVASVIQEARVRAA